MSTVDSVNPPHTHFTYFEDLKIIFLQLVSSSQDVHLNWKTSMTVRCRPSHKSVHWHHKFVCHKPFDLVCPSDTHEFIGLRERQMVTKHDNIFR